MLIVMQPRYTIQATTSTFTVLAQVLSLLLTANEDLFYLLISNLAEDSRPYILISHRALVFLVCFITRIILSVWKSIWNHAECLFYIRSIEMPRVLEIVYETSFILKMTKRYSTFEILWLAYGLDSRRVKFSLKDYCTNPITVGSLLSSIVILIIDLSTKNGSTLSLVGLSHVICIVE